MLITFIGDSLTAGNLGISYMSCLDLDSNVKMVNCGQDGDTVLGVRQRLQNVLRTNKTDALVVQVGANDILLPKMQKRNKEWDIFVLDMMEKGSIPTPQCSAFESVYEDIFSIAQSWAVPSLIGVTIPPIGENLDTPRNADRKKINKVIRRVVTKSGAHLADVAEAFESVLSRIPNPSDFFFNTPQDFIVDLRRIRRNRGARELSEERGLFLTMDGAHLNEHGANLMAGIIAEKIMDN